VPGQPPNGALPNLPGQLFNQRMDAEVAAGGVGTGRPALTVAQKTTFKLTDVILGAPQGDSGTLEVLTGNVVRITVALENFRTDDYHLLSPISVPAGQTVALRVSCRTAGNPMTGKQGGFCRAYIFVSGVMQAA
jgi:hypothetical protein